MNVPRVILNGAGIIAWAYVMGNGIAPLWLAIPLCICSILGFLGALAREDN